MGRLSVAVFGSSDSRVVAITQPGDTVLVPLAHAPTCIGRMRACEPLVLDASAENKDLQVCAARSPHAALGVQGGA
jgi:hypothetical protein